MGLLAGIAHIAPQDHSSGPVMPDFRFNTAIVPAIAAKKGKTLSDSGNTGNSGSVIAFHISHAPAVVAKGHSMAIAACVMVSLSLAAVSSLELALRITIRAINRAQYAEVANTEVYSKVERVRL